MSHPLVIVPALGLLLAQPGSVDPANEDTTTISPSPRIVRADVREGQHETCLLNPPLLLAAEKIVRIEPAKGNDVKALASTGERVQLIAFGPGVFFEDGRDPDEIVTISIDEITLVSGQLKSLTGQAWKLFDRAGVGAKTRLIPKSLQFSLCRHYDGSLASATSRRGRFGGVDSLPGRSNITAKIGAAASALLDIFGLSVASFVRVRLTSDPSEAEIYLGGARQPAKTDTVLDVIAAELPQLSIRRIGFKPCRFNEWTVKFEPGNKRLMHAGCKLVPLSRRRR